jgi:hypothetical protein
MYNRQAHARTTITLVLLCIFGWRANAHIHCVCLFVSYSFCHSSSLFLSISETNSCIEYDYERQRCTYICGQPVFLTDFLSCFLHRLAFFFFYSSISLLLPSRKTHAYTKKRISSEIAYLISFSFFRSFVTQIYNSKKRKTHPITTITKTDDLYKGIDDVRRQMRLH